MFRDGVDPAPRAEVAAEVAALFAPGVRPSPAPRGGRRVTAIVTAPDAVREARRLAPALRACRSLGDETEAFVLPMDDGLPLGDTIEAVGSALGVERVRPIPPPGPAARGLVQEELRHAYRTYEFLKHRAPDVVLSTQAFGVPCFALRARELGVCLLGTRFVIVLGAFDLQRRLNERLVTSKPHVLARFHLERAAAEGADVCVAPSLRFVENALRTSAAAEATRFMVLPEVEDASPAEDPAAGRPPAFVIPDVPPVARNAAFFAVVARRRPDALRGADGRIRLYVDAADPDGELAASCRRRFAGTEVEWTVGRPPPGEEPEAGGAALFVPFCEDFFALGAGLAPAVRGARILIGEGAAVGEPFEAAGVAAPPFPDAAAEALAEAAEGRRALRVRVRRADLGRPWTHFFENLSPPRRPAEAPDDSPRVTVCVLHFNRPGLVGQAVSSALAQTYENLDVLLFDDGSDAPGAVEALEALAGSHPGRVRLVRGDNRYLGAARNRAARAAQGEYVYFLDDDNVLKPRAIETLVRAARVGGADFVGSFSDVFTGDRAPGAEPAGQRILQAGGDGGISLLRNAILAGAPGGVRRELTLPARRLPRSRWQHRGLRHREGRHGVLRPRGPLGAPGGHRAGGALLGARHGHEGLKSSHFDPNAGFFRVLGAYWPALAPGYRAAFLLLQGMFIERDERIETLWREREAWRRTAAERRGRIEALSSTLDTAREGHFMALARRGGRFGFGRRPEVGVLLNPDWLARAWPRSAGAPALELRRNGRVVARVAAGDRVGDAVQLAAAGPRAPVFRDVLYSVHDARTGEGLAALAAPAFVRARRVEGAVEGRERPEVRGWVLDAARPERSRRVAVYVEGRLRAVLRADGRRPDIARWKGTGGRHGFFWPVPGGLAEGVRIDVHDADTGRLLPGSPVRVEGGRAAAAARRGA